MSEPRNWIVKVYYICDRCYFENVWYPDAQNAPVCGHCKAKNVLSDNNHYSTSSLLEQLEEILSGLASDCIDALHGKWDRGNDGFEAMACAAHTGLEILYILEDREKRREDEAHNVYGSTEET